MTLFICQGLHEIVADKWNVLWLVSLVSMYLEFLLESLLGWMRNFEVLVLLFAEFNLFGIWRTLEKLFFGLLHVRTLALN